MDVTILGEWWESVRALPDADRLAWFDGIFRYANGGELPAASDVWGNIGLGMARRMIDERARKSKAGRCGGRGHKAEKAETEEAKADGKHKERKIDRKIDRSATRGARAVPFDTVKSWADTHFCPPPDGDFLRMWHARMTESGWIDSRGHDLLVEVAGGFHVVGRVGQIVGVLDVVQPENTGDARAQVNRGHGVSITGVHLGVGRNQLFFGGLDGRGLFHGNPECVIAGIGLPGPCGQCQRKRKSHGR